MFATVIAVAAQPAATPGPPAPKSAEQSRAPIADRAKPQVVYNVRSRETAELLHAQSKPSTDNSLPVDANMPISLQISRSNANAEAAAAARAAETPAQTPVVPHVRRHKAQNGVHAVTPSGQPGPLMQSSGKRGHGHGHGKHGD